MRIVFVASPDDERVARWINQVTDLGWQVSLFPSADRPLSPQLQGKIHFDNSTNHTQEWAIQMLAKWPHPRGSGHARRLRKRLEDQSGRKLEPFLHKMKPDIVHSMDIQNAGSLSLAIKDRMGSRFPIWVVSNWGSDAFVNHYLPVPQPRIKQILEKCDYCTTECPRDVELAQKLGLQARLLPILSSNGGYDIERWQQFCQPVPTSRRRVILLKGNQNWAGRPLVGLRAIELCADVLRERGYSVLIHLPTPDVPLAAELTAYATRIPITVVYPGSYEDAMRRFSVARIHLGLSISDGMNQSLLDAMVMRTFPIQSHGSYTAEWIEDGKNGLLVPPEDPHLIAAALHRAITDDEFVDHAVKLNEETARQRFAYAMVKRQTIDLYESILDRAQSAASRTPAHTPGFTQ